MTSEGGANVNPGTGNDQELSFTTLGAGPEAGQQYVVTQDGLRRESQDMEDGVEESGHEYHDGGELREQDRFLPIANVARIMKKGIPSSQGKIAKEARLCVQECVSEFISFITSEASDRCQAEKRKTINGEDILFAMSTLGFDNYVEPLKLYLQKHREAMKGDKQDGEGGEFDIVSEEISATGLPQVTTDQSGNHFLLTYGTAAQPGSSAQGQATANIDTSNFRPM